MTATVRAPLSRRTFKFLSELAVNNDRDWFQANTQRYESDVLAPALAFIETMGPKLERISKHFLAVPKRTGGSLMRVHRDTRFSRNKAPYKTNIGIQFRHERGKDVHAPGFYVHIEPNACFLGAGIWHPDGAALAAIRERIIAHADDWRRIMAQKSFRAELELAGSRLKRLPRGFSADAPHIEDLKRKDFIAIGELSQHDVLAADFAVRAAARFKTGSRLMAFLCAALDLDF